MRGLADHGHNACARARHRRAQPDGLPAGHRAASVTAGSSRAEPVRPASATPPPVSSNRKRPSAATSRPMVASRPENITARAARHK
jgi:hypothetical protein